MSLKNLNVSKKTHKFLLDKLKDKRTLQIYKKFESNLPIKKNFIVAVSGGPDSMALAFLSQVYAIKNNLVPKFLIVDHKLRKESTAEARKVHRVLKKFKINAEILTWKGKKPNKNIQALARKKRYDLLISKCKQYKIDEIFLGHQQGDLIENFFIRMFRGAGLKGLVSLDKKSKFGNINLIRPLLNEKKADLEFLSQNVFQFYIEDPSNKNEKFQRIKIRKLIETFKINDLDKKKFVNTLKKLKQSDNVVSFYVKQNFAKNTFYLSKNNKLILNKFFFQQPYEVIFRTLSESIQLIGKKHYSARGKKLDRIIGIIKNNQDFKSTLGGCLIEKVNQTVIISQEY